MIQFSFAAHDFLYLYAHSLQCKKSLISILDGGVGFQQIAFWGIIINSDNLLEN